MRKRKERARVRGPPAAEATSRRSWSCCPLLPSAPSSRDNRRHRSRKPPHCTPAPRGHRRAQVVPRAITAGVGCSIRWPRVGRKVPDRSRCLRATTKGIPAPRTHDGNDEQSRSAAADPSPHGAARSSRRGGTSTDASLRQTAGVARHDGLLGDRWFPRAHRRARRGAVCSARAVAAVETTRLRQRAERRAGGRTQCTGRREWNEPERERGRTDGAHHIVARRVTHSVAQPRGWASGAALR